MLLDQDGPGLSRHDSVEETGTAYLCLNQRGDRTEQNHAGCQGGSQNAQPKAKRMGKLLLPRPSQQGLPCGRSTHPQAAASVVVHQAQSEVAGEETFPDGIVLPSAWSGQSYRLTVRQGRPRCRYLPGGPCDSSQDWPTGSRFSARHNTSG